jgi:excisionase family DNA binding protein
MKDTKTQSILLRGQEVADLLGVSRAKAYRLMANREIPVVMLGKSVRSPREALLASIRERTQHPLVTSA